MNTPIGMTIMSALQFLVMGVATVVYLVLVKEWDVLHWRQPELSDLAIVFGVAFACLLVNTVAGALFTVFDIQVAENVIVEEGENMPMYFLYMIPVMLLLVGPVEELLFRGVVQGVLREAVDVNLAIVFASLLFGFAHVAATGGFHISSLPYVLVTFVLGLVLGYVYERTESLVIPSIAHGIYNSFLLLLQYYAVTAGVV